MVGPQNLFALLQYNVHCVLRAKIVLSVLVCLKLCSSYFGLPYSVCLDLRSHAVFTTCFSHNMCLLCLIYSEFA